MNGPPQLLINDKPLTEFDPIGQPDGVGRMGAAILLALSFTQGLAWGSTVALLGRLSLRTDPDSEWQMSGTSPSVLPPVAAAFWGVALLTCSPIGGLLVDFRIRNVRIQFAAMLVWVLGCILLLWAALAPEGDSEPETPATKKMVAVLCVLGAALAVAGVAILRPLLTVLIADQVREPEFRAQAIGLCFTCFTAGNMASSMADAAGTPAIALGVLLLAVLVLGAGGLVAVRNVLDVGAEPNNPTAGLWAEFMPSGHGGGSEWSDDSLFSESGETAQGCCHWCALGMRRCRRHPLFGGFGSYVEGRHLRALVKVLILTGLVRSSHVCVDWGDQAAVMDPHLCFGGSAAAPSQNLPDDNDFPFPPMDASDARARSARQGGRRLLALPRDDGAHAADLGGGGFVGGWMLSSRAAAAESSNAVVPAPAAALSWAWARAPAAGPAAYRAKGKTEEMSTRAAVGQTSNATGGASAASSCLDVGHDAVAIGGGVLGLLIVLSICLSAPDDYFWSRSAEDRLTWGYVAGLASVATAGVLQAILAHQVRASILWQLPQYAAAMVADCLVVVSALEYVYDGKTRWPRAGTTAALFAFQGMGLLLGLLLSRAWGNSADKAWGSNVIMTPALSLVVLLIDRCV